MAKCIAAEGRFFKKIVNFCLVRPISNEYPETFGASLVVWLLHRRDGAETDFHDIGKYLK